MIVIIGCFINWGIAEIVQVFIVTHHAISVFDKTALSSYVCM